LPWGTRKDKGWGAGMLGCSGAWWMLWVDVGIGYMPIAIGPTSNSSHAGISTDANEQSDGNVRALALVAYAKLECEWVGFAVLIAAA